MRARGIRHMLAAYLLSADRQAASVGLALGFACKKLGPVMVKAAIGALLVLLILLAVVKLADWLLVGVSDLSQVQPSKTPADIAAHEQRAIGLV
jgi:hypothetical protein